MAQAEKIYRRLPGRGANLFQHSRLYEGPDHLLMVMSSGYSENYKRFFYRDIQSFTLEKTAVANLWSAAWGFLFFASLTFAAIGSGRVAIFFGIVAAGFLILLGTNLALGPSCKCTIKTAVQTEHLNNFRRLRSARKVLVYLETLIHGAQGMIGPADLQGGVATSNPEPAPPRMDSDPPGEGAMDVPPAAREG